RRPDQQTPRGVEQQPQHQRATYASVRSGIARMRQNALGVPAAVAEAVHAGAAREHHACLVAHFDPGGREQGHAVATAAWDRAVDAAAAAPRSRRVAIRPPCTPPARLNCCGSWPSVVAPSLVVGPVLDLTCRCSGFKRMRWYDPWIVGDVDL